jgi:hypothetical protein
MPSNEIKKLREEGKFEEAYIMAKSELDAEPGNIWAKRNLSWVLYAQLNTLVNDTDAFIEKLEEVKKIELPENEEMFFDTVSIAISKAARVIGKEVNINTAKLNKLFDSVRELPFKRNGEWFSVLYSGFHKAMKESDRYIEFADWWDFSNFKAKDFEKDKLPNGKEMMSMVEQAYIAYAKHLLKTEEVLINGENIHNVNASKLESVKVFIDKGIKVRASVIDRNKIQEFLVKLDLIIEEHPEYLYPPYYKGKLLLAIGNKENVLSSLLPFAKKRSHDFWVWDLLSEVFIDDEEKVFSLYCRALCCHSPEEMLVKLRQKITKFFIEKEMYNEAKTEIKFIEYARNLNEWPIPPKVNEWMREDWYKNAIENNNNRDVYKKYISIAEQILYSDIEEKKVFVNFVNNERKILNFILNEKEYGFFKYDRLLTKVEVGDILKVRVESGKIGDIYKVYTACITDDEEMQQKHMKSIDGKVTINKEKGFGLVDGVYIGNKQVLKYKLNDGAHFKGIAVKSFNTIKGEWSWQIK